ncbi:MAG: hypothetical protein M5U01_09195 [Ardenticatenaceae bacterium]|nr:hypothetical protein [Ardenticatenaceae bacterium]
MAELVGDLLLFVGALCQQDLDRLVLGDAEEMRGAQEAAEGPQGEGSSRHSPAYQEDVPDRSTFGGVYQHPALAVGDQSKAHLCRAPAGRHPCGRRGDPVVIGEGLLEVLSGGDKDLHQQAHSFLGHPASWG